MEQFVIELLDKALNKNTGMTYALKYVKHDNEGVIFKQIAVTSFREIEILRRTNHPNVIKLHNIIPSPKGLFLVMDYGGEDLAYQFDYRKVKFSELQIKGIMKQLLRGLISLHEQGIIHRDLKLSNILVDRTNFLRICDFGLARAYSEVMTKGVVTLWYRPPEILLGIAQYTTAIDMWSVGCIFAELLNNGKPILPGKSEVNQFQLICKLIGSPNSKIWPEFSFMSPTFPIPENNYNTLNLLFSNYSQECIDFLNSLLVWDPCKRLSAAEALLSSYLIS